MSAQSWASTRSLVASGLAGTSGLADAARQQARTVRGPMLAIVCGYWLYVSLSNVLYAQSMSAGLGAVTGRQLFSPVAARVTQHLLLLPVLLLCYGISLRTGWQPLWRKLAAQLSLAALFELLAQPALEAGNYLFMPEHASHDREPHAMMGWLTSTGLALWSASATNFLLQYGFGLTLVTAFSLYQRIRDSELRVAAMERAWSAARLAALRMQLSPHTCTAPSRPISRWSANSPMGSQRWNRSGSVPRSCCFSTSKWTPWTASHWRGRSTRPRCR